METFEKIGEKAGELFLKYGIRAVTMDDIAEQLGMAKKTIYKFFENKNALVKHFIVKETVANADSCNSLTGTANDPIIELFFLMVYAQRFYAKINPSVIHMLERDYHTSYLILKQHKDDFLFRSIKACIGKGIAQQLYQSDFNVDSMSGFFLESLAVISDAMPCAAKQYNITAREEIIGHMICGIATTAGLDKINYYKSQRQLSSFMQLLNQPYWED